MESSTAEDRPSGHLRLNPVPLFLVRNQMPMTDVLVYDKDYRFQQAEAGCLHWHSNHRVFADLLPGDRLWVVTSGRSLGREDESAGYLVAMSPIQQVVENPGDDPEFPARKFGHRILVNQTEALQLDQPVCVDHIIRGEGYDQSISVGRFLRGPRRLSDQKVRQLFSAAGADMAQKWLLGNKPKPATSAATTKGKRSTA
jgi:hypothetical protein